jgi:hypothetical protein
VVGSPKGNPEEQTQRPLVSRKVFGLKQIRLWIGKVGENRFGKVEIGRRKKSEKTIKHFI